VIRKRSFSLFLEKKGIKKEKKSKPVLTLKKGHFHFFS